MNNTEWFDEISLAYARHFRELEAARDRFDLQSETLIGELAESLRTAAQRRGLSAAEMLGGRGKTGPWKNLTVTGQFSAALEVPRVSAISVGFARGDFWADGTDLDFCLVFYLGFTVSKPAYAAMDLARRWKEACPGAVESHYANQGFYLVLEQIRSDDGGFHVERARNAIGRLVDAFDGTDAWMAHAYRERVHQAGH